MKNAGTAFLIIYFTFIILSSACKNELLKTTNITTLPSEVLDVDPKSLGSLTGCIFRILKSETLGYIPLHKFYWICLNKKVNDQELRELANAIIKNTILKNPRTYLSITIHFFLENEL